MVKWNFLHLIYALTVWNFHTGGALVTLGFFGNGISSRMLCLSKHGFLFLSLLNILAWSGNSHISPYFTLTLSLSLCLSVPHLSLHTQVSPVTMANPEVSSGVMRLLGVAFPGEKQRDEWEREQEEARKRDHRRIGKVRVSEGREFGILKRKSVKGRVEAGRV